MSHLTILLPLKDRAPFTRRWLAYAGIDPVSPQIFVPTLSEYE